MRAKNQFYFNPEASQFHNRVRVIFITELPFANMTCFQEVNVKELVPDYPYNNHHFDWFVKELDLVLELHGAQHYKPVNYGNQGAGKVISNFRDIRFRDSLKQAAAEEAGYTYRAIPYTDQSKLSAQYILSLLE